MVIKESQLLNIIHNAILEALDPSVEKAAQGYINHKGGYTTNQSFNGLGGALRQRFGSRNDSNGQREWEKSANEIQGLIRSYNNEIKRLTRAYNFIIGRVSTGWSDERKEAAAKTRAFNAQWRKDNGVDTSTPVWKNRAVGSGVDSTKYAAQRQDRRARNNSIASQGNQKWLGSMQEEVEEGFFGNLFGKRDNEVEQICANYRQYKGNQDAANKLLAKINEYKETVKKLKSIINQGVQTGNIQNAASATRARMNADRRAAAKYNKTVAESIDKIVGEKIKAILG